jgi:hypothetical protein
MTDNRENIVERVALAIKAELGRALNARPMLGDVASGNWYTEEDASAGSLDLTVIARAAIAAMKEPTPEMVKAGDDALEWDSSDVNGSLFVRYNEGDAGEKSWPAMISAALEE